MDESSRTGCIEVKSMDTEQDCQTAEEEVSYLRPDVEPGDGVDMVENVSQSNPWNAYYEDIKAARNNRKESLRARHVVLTIIKMVAVIGFWYIFICSLDLVGSAFHLLGIRAVVKIFRHTNVIMNPICGLVISVLVTVILQSSTTSTFLAVTLVANGSLTVKQAIPLVMGANLGTTITGTIVSLTQSWQRDEHMRAFAAAALHTLFNLLTICVLLPLEVLGGYLYHLSSFMVQILHVKKQTNDNLMQYVFTRPLTDRIVQLDYEVIQSIVSNDPDTVQKPVLKYWCESGLVTKNLTFPKGDVNLTLLHDIVKSGYVNHTDGDYVTYLYNVTEGIKPCSYILHGRSNSETTDGFFILFGSLFVLCFSLLSMVKLLHSLLKNRHANKIRKYINADFPGNLHWLTGYVTIIIAAMITFLVQGSSVFTSTLIPVVGIGVLSIERAYPLILGANVGTAIRGIMVAMSAYGDGIHSSLQLAFCHVFFNISGLILYYPIPFIKNAPLRLARTLGNMTAKYPWSGVLFMIIVYFVVPGAVIGLSIAGWPVLVGVAAPVCVFVIVGLTTRFIAKWWRRAKDREVSLLKIMGDSVKRVLQVVLPMKTERQVVGATQNTSIVTT